MWLMGFYYFEEGKSKSNRAGFPKEADFLMSYSIFLDLNSVGYFWEYLRRIMT